MNEKRKYIIVAMATAVLTLMVSAGFALAQDDAATTDEDGIIAARGSRGPGGFGERGEQARYMVGGEVVSATDASITITALRSGEEVTVAVNGDTEYLSKDGDVTLADVVPGEHVGIRLTEPREESVELVAAAVMIGAPDHAAKPRPAIGDVTGIDGSTVTINTAEGEKQFTLPEITEGMKLGVAADEDGNVKAVIYDPPEKPAEAPADAE